MTDLLFKKITTKDSNWLYKLLKERDDSMNISHRAMPTYLQHCNFVKEHPYGMWYAVWHGRLKIGHWYLTKQNEVGLFVARKYQWKGYGTRILATIAREFSGTTLLANINPKNKRSLKLFKSLGFGPVQVTLRRDGKGYN